MVKISLSNNLSSKKFVKNFRFKKDKIVIKLSVKDVPLTMDAFPNSRIILKQHLPSIFRCQCFNPLNQSFYKEAKNTEIGHLFEHILLEYMCMEKIQYTNEISYSGKTSWDSRKMTGNFRIEVQCGPEDIKIFNKSLDNTISLMDVILSEGKTDYLYTQRKQSGKQAVSFLT